MNSCKLETNGPCEVESDDSVLADFDVDDLIESLPCSNTAICSNSENITDEDVNEFLKAYRQKPNKAKIQTEAAERDNKFRTIAKSFAPQSCNARDKKLSKPDAAAEPSVFFKTAKEELDVQNIKKYGASAAASANGGQKRKLGTRRGVQSKFVSPVLSSGDM